MKKRTLNELRQVKTYGYRPPSPSKEKEPKEKEKEPQKNIYKYECKYRDIS